MKATIEAEDSNNDEKYEITLTDDRLDNSNYVEMIIKRESQDSYDVIIVPIKDLYDLVNMFDNRRYHEQNKVI